MSDTLANSLVSEYVCERSTCFPPRLCDYAFFKFFYDRNVQ